jgi:rare lipoprotein A
MTTLGEAAARRGGHWLVAIVCLAGLSLGACASTRPQVAMTASPAAQVELLPTVSAHDAKARAAVTAVSPGKTLRQQRRSAKAGRTSVGAPYRIAGVWYKPAYQADYDVIGVASWYGNEFDGRATATGERFDMRGISAAHATLPLNAVVEVTNLENGRSIRVRLNDRGPFKPNRIIDLSRGAAQQLGYVNKGLARVRVRVIDPGREAPPAPIFIQASGQQVASASVRPPRRRASRLETASSTSSSIVLAYEAGMQRIALARNGRQSGLASYDTSLAPLW